MKERPSVSYRDNFRQRVDYATKALRRGSWGSAFDHSLSASDGGHLVAVIMHRARNNQDLRRAIMAAFCVDKWADVPWHKTANVFTGFTAQQIRADAEDMFPRLVPPPARPSQKYNHTLSVKSEDKGHAP